MTREEMIQALVTVGYKSTPETSQRFADPRIFWPLTSGKLARMDCHGILRGKSGRHLASNEYQPASGWKDAIHVMQDLLREMHPE